MQYKVFTGLELTCLSISTYKTIECLFVYHRTRENNIKNNSCEAGFFFKV